MSDIVCFSSWRVDCTWAARKAPWRTRRSSACRMTCGGGRQRMAQSRLQACFCAAQVLCRQRTETRAPALSCTEKLTNETSTCPECRDEFESDNIRQVFIMPSVNNNSSGSQTTSTHESSGDQKGFIRQAKHIARCLGKTNASTRAESVKTAADVIEQVATIQCREAQARLTTSRLCLTLL